ncbi:MAG: carboxylesterase/lipase family protein [Anaerolineales bacterium]|nr:carboxylesterase/lipase family protein [Anaerolineales bacterium]
MPMQTIVETSFGKLQGYFTGQCLLFAGIPYAAPPTGPHRFRPPAPPAAWAGVRDATQFGPIQPQTPSRFERFLGPENQPQAEDSLRLNVWTPAADAGNRPVLLYIHGGAWVSGSGSMPLYHGESFAARHDLVAVTLNYRLGEAGSLYLGHLDPDFAGAGNLTILDAIAALSWIRDNISAFGGDPDNVTICGQSAGAHTIIGLLTAPLARGLFHRAISHSLSSLTPLRGIPEAVATAAQFCQHSGLTSIAALQAAPVEALLAARGATMRAASPWRIPWGMVLDGAIIPEQPLVAAATGRLAPVPLLIGACRDDYRPYPSVLPPAVIPRDEAALVRHFDSLGFDGTALVQHYQATLGPLTPVDLFVAAMSDRAFIQPTILFAERHAQHQPTYLFDFAWASPVQNGALGAGHTVELPFAFHRLWTPSTPYQLGASPPSLLADQMHAAWASFIRAGVPRAPGLPEWPRYDDQMRATMVFDTPSHLQTDPARERRRLWADLLK